ncbi:MAG: HPP family protein [Pseudomonadota bacterium]
MRLSQRFGRVFGPATPHVGPAEQAVSAFGGFLGIYLVFLLSHAIIGPEGAVWMVVSMGATAVLLFGVPHGLLSQPWPLFGGHLVSALIGVTCAQWIPDTALAAACAVGLAVGAMHLLRCIHPPGGATALAAVLGGPAVTALGYQYVLAPVLLNVAIVFVVAVAANYPFAWRRYPIQLMRFGAARTKASRLHEEDIDQALREMHVIVDVTPDELMQIAERALRHAEEGGEMIHLEGRPVTLLPGDEGAAGPFCGVAIRVRGT